MKNTTILKRNRPAPLRKTREEPEIILPPSFKFEVKFIIIENANCKNMWPSKNSCKFYKFIVLIDEKKQHYCIFFPGRYQSHGALFREAKEKNEELKNFSSLDAVGYGFYNNDDAFWNQAGCFYFEDEYLYPDLENLVIDKIRLYLIFRSK